MDITGVFAICITMGTLFVGLPWLILHYLTKWRTQNSITKQDEVLLDELHDLARRLGDRIETVLCRMRSLGCTHCPGAILSSAVSPADIISELQSFRRSERENRLIDHDQEGSMELKKREGYF